MNIILLDLPEKEIAYIKRNCNDAVGEGKVSVAELDAVDLPEELENVLRVQEKECPQIVISGKKSVLTAAINAGVTTIAYQNPEGESCYLPVDMVVEGFEEIDVTFLQHVYERHYRIPWTILETKRLIVRELTLADMDDLFELYSYEGMTDYMEGLYPYEEEYAYQEAYIENMYRFFGYGMWLVFEKASGKLVGRAGVEHREALGGELELGYAIGAPWQGQGFAGEVCAGILTYVKDELGFDEISSLVEPANLASVHLLEKLDFSLEQELDLDGIRYKKYKKCLKPL